MANLYIDLEPHQHVYRRGVAVALHTQNPVATQFLGHFLVGKWGGT
jgi:hypothetical protein